MRAPAVALALLVVLGAAAAAVWVVVQEPPAEPVPPPARTAVAQVRTSGQGAGSDEPGTAAGPLLPPAPTPGRADPFAKEPPIPEYDAEPQPGAGQRFSFGPWGGDAAKVDWRSYGIDVRKARRAFLLAVWSLEREAADRQAAQFGVIQGQLLVQRHLEPMILPLHEARLDPEFPPPMEIFAYPIVEANGLAAALDAWGLPLTVQQERALGDLYAEYSKEWTHHREGGVATWPLEGLVGATAARVALQPKIEAILTPEQTAALWPAELQGRLQLDVFGAANLWRERLMPLEVPEKGDRREPYAEYLLASFVVDYAQRDLVAQALSAWIDANQKDMLAGVRGATSRAGWFAQSEWLPLVEAWPALANEIEARLKRPPPAAPPPKPKWLDHSIPGQRPPPPPPVIPRGRRVPVPVPVRR